MYIHTDNYADLIKWYVLTDSLSEKTQQGVLYS